MRYFIIAGEASGDIHGSALINALRQQDSDAQFEFLGGDLMASSAGCEPLIHYRDMAFMGFIEVIKHLGNILGFMKKAKMAMTTNRPDALILIDYPSFNLKMAKWAHNKAIPVFYFTCRWIVRTCSLQKKLRSIPVLRTAAPRLRPIFWLWPTTAHMDCR